MINDNRRATIITFFVIQAVVVLCLIRELFLHNYHNVTLCILSIGLFFLPSFISKKLNLYMPNLLEISILIFIFSAEILGEIANFYSYIPYWDNILHTVNGFLTASIGFSLINILNKNIKDIHITPLFVAIFAFSFAMTIGVIWEFFEFYTDYFFKTDMQKDSCITSISSISFNDKNQPIIIDNISYTLIYNKNNDLINKIDNCYLDIGLIDTMEDLLVNLIGALIFSLFGYFYITNNKRFHFIDFFRINKSNN